MLTMVDVAWLRLGYVLSSLPHVHHLFFWQRTIAAVIRTALAKSENWVIYKSVKTRNLRLGLFPYYNNLHAEYLTSYTNMLQLIGYQYFTQCKILQVPPTHNLHNPHAATRHKHGSIISRHRGAEKSVTPTDYSTSLWRIIPLHTSKPTARQRGGVCKMYAGECKILWNYLTLLKHLYINLLHTKSVRWQWNQTLPFTSGLTGSGQTIV